MDMLDNNWKWVHGFSGELQCFWARGVYSPNQKEDWNLLGASAQFFLSNIYSIIIFCTFTFKFIYCSVIVCFNSKLILNIFESDHFRIELIIWWKITVNYHTFVIILERKDFYSDKIIGVLRKYKKIEIWFCYLL